MKVLIVFGTRPEAIKMAPVIKKLENKNDIDVVTCVTGQHREMLDQVLEIFNIVPDYDLTVMKEGQDLYDITANILSKIKPVLKTVRPDIVLVHGDTTTAMVTSLASFYEKIPVAHVEAGLRTYNLMEPWPEESNRQIIDRLATLYYAPVESSKMNLNSEGIKDNIIVTGNTVIDALLMINESNKEVSNQLYNEINLLGYDLRREKRIILVTGHRRENFGIGFENICSGLEKIANSFPEIDLVYPVHLNPNVRRIVFERLGKKENIFLIEPLHYRQFVFLMNESYLVLTDSGGIQEEAPSLGKPVLVMRDTTERPEAIDAGTAILVGTDPEKMFSNVQQLLENPVLYRKMSMSHNPYGDGNASDRIYDSIINFNISE